MDKNVTCYLHLLQHRDLSLDINWAIRYSKNASCCHLSIPTFFSYLHKPFQQFDLKNTNVQHFNKYFLIMEYHQNIILTLIPWKYTYIFFLCLPWNTRFPYLFWMYSFLQIFNKQFTIQKIDGTLQWGNV
jgi:hypothetical protein